MQRRHFAQALNQLMLLTSAALKLVCSYAGGSGGVSILQLTSSILADAVEMEPSDCYKFVPVRTESRTNEYGSPNIQLVIRLLDPKDPSEGRSSGLCGRNIC
eukprot:SAG31_NODE_1548_length_7914_cov_5.353423_5_plen_102_part_00